MRSLSSIKIFIIIIVFILSLLVGKVSFAKPTISSIADSNGNSITSVSPEEQIIIKGNNLYDDSNEPVVVFICEEVAPNSYTKEEIKVTVPFCSPFSLSAFFFSISVKVGSERSDPYLISYNLSRSVPAWGETGGSTTATCSGACCKPGEYCDGGKFEKAANCALCCCGGKCMPSALNLQYPEVGGQTLYLGMDLNKLIVYFYYFIVSIAGIAAFCVIIWGGFLYLTSAGNPSRIRQGKDRIFSALLGLVIIFSSYIILKVINPELLIISLPSLPSL